MVAGLTANFDSSSLGYNRSSKGLATHVDIMNRSPSPSIENLFNSGAMNDPVYEQQSFTESLITGNTRTETLMETMKPNKSYAPPKIDAQSKMRDVNKVVTDGKQVSRQTDNAVKATQENIANLTQDWNQAKGEALGALKGAAVDSGINSADAVNSLIPDSSASKGTALAYVAAEAVTAGAGTMATMGKGAFIVSGLSKDDEKLSVQQQEALLEDTMKSLQTSSSSSNDTRANPNAGSSVSMDAPKQSDIAWENMETDDLAEFLAADIDDQPEMQELRQMESDLDVVKDNHAYVANNYDKTNVIEKSIALGATGQSKVVERELNNAVVAVDAPSVDLAGQMLGGITKINVGNNLAANDAIFTKFANVSDISTRINEPDVNYGILAPELKGYAMGEFNIG